MARVNSTGGSGYVIDNGTGLNVRTKLNQITAAINSLNSGTGDPTINTAFQPHINTSTSELKIRNAANDGYITLGRVDQTNFGLFPVAGGTFTGEVTHGYTGAMRLPVGTTAQRPGSPSVGDFRYNSTDNNIEFYNGSSFISSGIAAGSIVNADVNSSADIDATKLSFTQTGSGASARTVTSRFQDTISVLDYIPPAEHAAIRAGTSTYNATTKIQAALDQGAVAGVSVYLPAGTYQVENTINIKSNNHFFGAGEASIIRMKSTIGRETTLVRTGSRDNKVKNVIIEHMTLDFNKARHSVSGGTQPTDSRINDGAALSSSDANFSSTFTVNGGSDDFSASGGDVFQDINRTTLCICFSEDVLINNVRALNGYKHCIDITSPKYRHSNSTTSDANFLSGGATSLQSAQIYDTVRQNGTASKSDGSLTLTITISGGHGYSVGDQVYLNVSGTTFDGMYKIDTVPSTTTFTVQVLRKDETISGDCYVIQDQGSKRVTLQNCYAKGAGDDNITTHFSSDILITGCHSEYPCGSLVPQNSNCFEIDDGSRNVTLTNCIANNGNKGFQIKGHRYAPAPYNITVDGLRITNCAESIDIKHQGYGATASDGTNFDALLNAWAGGQTLTNPNHQIRSGSITYTGASPTAKNISLSNVQIIAPTGYKPDSNYGSIGLIKADKQIQLYAYESVMFTNIMINDGRDDLAGDQNLALSTLAENDAGTNESDDTGLDEVVHILYGAQNVSFKNLSIHGFRSSAFGLEVASSLLQHISVDGFFCIDGPNIAATFNETSGNYTAVIDNYFIVRSGDAVSGSVGIRNNQLGTSFIRGNGSIVRYATEVQTLS